ncbi:nuclease-related domain-containing protein [Sanguibacter sp. 4.1]|uniref:Nuclease-related domain-containing protein n=1 Tax=Sanguibacter biliveldensis TaxID=3030830 RepID=A0AAF0Z282_9MICO|nr:nuclease-related domain-containing protein [Sanguibacter sp. 4.1]WPF80904.1 nuclease-related domain-containing protein [Sanguibacter sp. 4.1]
MGEHHDTNLPGAGAEELASRASRRAARLRHDQAMGHGADAAVDEQLRQAERRLRTYSQGAEGERLVAQALGFLERYGWVALHDVHWPGRPKANIDHIAVGPGGIVVIDAKNWTGDVVVRDGVLRQNGYSRERETTSAATATSAVAARIAAMHRSAVVPVLCLVAQDVEPVVLGQTTVVGRSGLAAHLVSLPVRLAAYEVADVARFLASDLGGPRSPEVLTSADLVTQTLARAGFTVTTPVAPRRVHGRSRATSTVRQQGPRTRTSAPTSTRRGKRQRVGPLLLRLTLGIALVLSLPYSLPWLAETLGPVLGSMVVPEVPTQQPTEQP